ncbi:MAG: BamA/TamA family outer membrane protein, partial [Rhodothermales bacterium]|nr:BamA/TamA family outer membrane protein [Rhodothermales bacterium]
PQPSPDVIPDFADSTVTVSANPGYAASPLKELFMGAHNRDVWTQPVSVPVFDIGTSFGGLKPIKRGGGMQTVSLRMENPEGRQYVLRSIDKRPENSIPEVFRETVARDVLRDQTSAQHPYGAFAIPSLADAIGVFHTSPELVFVPDDPRLLQYRSTFANQLMMLEDRPDDDMSEFANYGNSKNVVSVGSMYEDILDDNDNSVDQRAFLRVRLFDMLLSDWDRHRDQWRWAEFKTDDGAVFRPIPRDRDWALNKWDGLFPSLASFFDPKFRGFKESYGDLRGLSRNGYEQDRRLLNSLERDAWIDIADSIAAALTDSVIEEAFTRLPKEAYDLSGADLIRIMKIRRDKLRQVAEDYFEIQARIVDVVGSNKHEEFVVERLQDGRSLVSVYKIRKTGERRKLLYKRSFVQGETDEIRIFGLGGNDRFEVSGNVRKAIRLIAVGGTGDDQFIDRSSVRGLRKRTVFYDSRDGGNTWDPSRETRVVASSDPLINRYDQRAGFSHNSRSPKLFLGLNRDDGLFIGGGLNSVLHGFRKVPYASSNTLVGNYAFRTQAYNIAYSGHFVSLVGSYDATVDLHAFSPTSIRNFYGLGNETRNTVGDRTFYQAGIQRYGGSFEIGRSGGGRLMYAVGPFVESINVQEDSLRFVVLPQPGLSRTTFSNQLFTGVVARAGVSTLDHAVNPKFGINWTASAAHNIGLTDNTNNYTKVESDFALFISPLESPQVTTAFRFGGRHTFGEFPFFDAASIGASSNLRGYRNNRFAGRSAAFANAEIRTKLLDVSTLLAIGELGLLGFIDTGRVWTDDESSDVWHSGYGGGLWFNYADLFIIQGSVGISDEGNYEKIGFGFQF